MVLLHNVYQIMSVDDKANQRRGRHDTPRTSSETESSGSSSHNTTPMSSQQSLVLNSSHHYNVRPSPHQVDGMNPSRGRYAESIPTQPADTQTDHRNPRNSSEKEETVCSSVSVGVQTDTESQFREVAISRRGPIDLDAFVCDQCNSLPTAELTDPSSSEYMDMTNKSSKTPSRSTTSVLSPPTACSSARTSKHMSQQSDTWSTCVQLGEPVNINELTCTPTGHKHIVNYVSQYTTAEIAPLLLSRTPSSASAASSVSSREKRYLIVHGFRAQVFFASVTTDCCTEVCLVIN